MRLPRVFCVVWVSTCGQRLRVRTWCGSWCSDIFTCLVNGLRSASEDIIDVRGKAVCLG